MEWQLTLVVIGLPFLVLLLIGVPIGVSLGIVGMTFIVATVGLEVGLDAIGINVVKALANYDTFAIMFYVFMGELMLASGLADDLYDFASKWFGWIPGGLALVAVSVGTIFATISGSTAASTSTIGRISIPQMLERGYSKRLAVGSVCAAGGLAHLIPPSILMVVYASFNELAVGPMLIAGFLPGFMVASFYSIIAVVWGWRSPSSAPTEAGASWKDRLFVLRKLIGPALVMFAVMGTLMLGIATVTESAVMGAVMTLILVAFRRTLSWRLVKEALLGTSLTTSFIVFIIIGAKLFSWTLQYTSAPQHIVEFVGSLPVTPIQLIILFMLLYFILGMFLDTMGQIFITMPIILPILYSLNFDPIWFGIMFFINVEMGMITPPYGSILYIVKGIAPPSVKITDILWGAFPFFIGDVLAISLIMAFPSIALWLPYIIYPK